MKCKIIPVEEKIRECETCDKQKDCFDKIGVPFEEYKEFTIALQLVMDTMEEAKTQGINPMTALSALIRVLDLSLQVIEEDTKSMRFRVEVVELLMRRIWDAFRENGTCDGCEALDMMFG